MAPASKKRRGTQYRPPKKIKESAKELPCISMAASPTLSHLEGQNSNDISSNGCSTPKSPRYQIPEPLTCPPAPKKRRVALHCSPPKPNVSFFNPPDLEAFFYFALRNVSV